LPQWDDGVYSTNSNGKQRDGVALISHSEGLVTPNCYCGNTASIKTVKKSGPNTGMYYLVAFACIPH